jgi:hypothetical protein
MACVTCGEKRNRNRVAVGKPEGKTHLKVQASGEVGGGGGQEWRGLD